MCERRNYSLIARDEPARVLLVEGEQGATLPAHTADDPAALVAHARDTFGLATVLLGGIHADFDAELEPIEQVFALEVVSGDGVAPAAGRWVARGELDAVKFAQAEHQTLVETWFAELGTGLRPPERAAWARPGWWREAHGWIASEIAQLDLAPAGSITQTRVTPTSHVLHAPTSGGALYFKATSPGLAAEIALTETLAEIWPAHAPRVPAADHQRHWMLLEDAGTPLRQLTRADRDFGRWEAMLRTYARLQIASAGLHERLLAAGLPDRRLELLPALYEALVADTAALLVGHSAGVSAADQRRLERCGPEVGRLCDRLAAFGIPAGLHHDDFHDNNIALRGDDYVFFDWGECSLTHPFFSLMITLRAARHLHGAGATELDRLRDAYLSAWTDYAPIEQLREAWTLASRLAKLCRALTWHDITATVEPRVRPHFAGSAPYWLLLFLNDAD